MPASLYAALDVQLQGRNRQSRKVANNTYLLRHNADIALRLHETDICTITPASKLTIDLGGYNTLTTRDRLNVFLDTHSNQWPERFQVQSIKATPYLMRYDAKATQTRKRRVYEYLYPNGTRTKEWSRELPAELGQTMPRREYGRRVPIGWDSTTRKGLFVPVAALTSPVTIDARGKVTGGATPRELARQAELRADINAYAKAMAAACPLEQPPLGDCWYCYMFDGKAEPGKLPEHLHADHLLSHMAEDYFVPSLMWQALLFNGCTPDAGGSFWFNVAFRQNQTPEPHARQTLARMVQKYLTRALGL